MTVETNAFWSIIAYNELDVPALSAAADPRLQSAVRMELAYARAHPDHDRAQIDTAAVLDEVVAEYNVVPELRHAVMNYCEERLTE